MKTMKAGEAYAAHRPLMHYAPPRGWMNDPNGMIYAEGWYHLFFQHNPHRPVWGDIHWAHARSRNLVNWEDCGLALAPDEKGMIFSGSMVRDVHNTAGFGEGALVAVFTHHGVDGVQSQSLAYSLDGGAQFTKYEGNPVLRQPGEKDFRDPKVIWYDQRDCWVMVISAGAKVSFYASKNLREWTFLSSIAEPDGYTMECPDLFSLEDRWVLTYSLIDRRQAGPCVAYRIGHFDGRRFQPDTEATLLDYGPDHYAAVTFFGIPDRILGLGWMNHWLYAGSLPEHGFRGSMTLPREYALCQEKKRLKIVPAREIVAAFLPENTVQKKGSLLLDQMPCVITLQGAQWGDVRIGNDTDRIEMGFDAHRDVAYAARYGACAEGFTNSASRFECPLWVQPGEPVELKAFLDVGSLEVFVDDQAVISLQYHWDQSPSQALFFGDGVCQLLLAPQRQRLWARQPSPRRSYLV